MEKKADQKKEKKVSFGDRKKKSSRTSQSLSPKILMLMGDRTIRQVAKDWGIPPSNINNYLYRDSMPRASTLKRIADKEGVSLDYFQPVTIDSLETRQRRGQKSREALKEAYLTGIAPKSSSHKFWNQVIDFEDIKEKVIQLIGKRDLTTAALNWDIPSWTLSDFINRGISPSFEVLERIAECEYVPVGRIILRDPRDGEEKRPYPEVYSLNSTPNFPPQTSKQAIENEDDESEDEFIIMLSALTDGEKLSLTKLMKRKGVEVLLNLLNEKNIEIMQLPDLVKDKIISTYIGLPSREEKESKIESNEEKICASGMEEGQSKSILTSDKKQAG